MPTDKDRLEALGLILSALKVPVAPVDRRAVFLPTWFRFPTERVGNPEEWRSWALDWLDERIAVLDKAANQ